MRGATVAAILILATGVAAGGPWAEKTEARCDTSGNCFPSFDEDPEVCVYEATYEGVTILMVCFAEVEEDSESDQASMLAAVHGSKVSASAVVSVSINITRNSWHDDPNDYTLYFNPNARHIAWKGDPMFNGSLGGGQPDSQHHEARFQVNATAPSGPFVVQFVFWDDTERGIRRAALNIDVERRPDGTDGGPPTPGLGALAAVAVVVAVGILRGARGRRKDR